MSDSSRPHGLQPTGLLHLWDFPGKSTGVGAIAFSAKCSRHSIYDKLDTHLYVVSCLHVGKKEEQEGRSKVEANR